MGRAIGLVAFVVVVALAGGWRVAAQENAGLEVELAVLEADVVVLAERVAALEAGALPPAVPMAGQADYCISRDSCESPLAEGVGRFRMLCTSVQIWAAPSSQPGPAGQQNVELGCHRVYDVPAAAVEPGD